jgi:hypothetical protein
MLDKPRRRRPLQQALKKNNYGDGKTWLCRLAGKTPAQ